MPAHGHCHPNVSGLCVSPCGIFLLHAVECVRHGSTLFRLPGQSGLSRMGRAHGTNTGLAHAANAAPAHVATGLSM